MRGAVRTIVLDANVYLSALVFGGKPAALLERAHGTDRAFRLLVSPAILVEVARNLKQTFDWPDLAVVKAVAFLSTVSKEVQPTLALSVIAHEPDNRILECAVAGKAAYVVSGDKHLLELGSYQGILILTVSDMLEILEWDAGPGRVSEAAGVGAR